MIERRKLEADVKLGRWYHLVNHKFKYNIWYLKIRLATITLFINEHVLYIEIYNNFTNTHIKEYIYTYSTYVYLHTMCTCVCTWRINKNNFFFFFIRKHHELSKSMSFLPFFFTLIGRKVCNGNTFISPKH